MFQSRQHRRSGALSISRQALTSLWVKYHFAHSHSPNRNKTVLKEEIDRSGGPVCIATQKLGVRGVASPDFHDTPRMVGPQSGRALRHR